MLSRLTPMTLLLATVAAWALVSAMVASAGLGGKFSLHPEDPSLVPPLPDTRQVDEQAVFDYTTLTEASERPLFSVDRRPAPVSLAEGEAVDEAVDLIVTSIVMTPNLQAALVRREGSEETERVLVGEDVPGSPGWRLLELQPRMAVFDGPEGEVDLQLRVFDGQGGEAPTSVAPASVTREGTTSRREAIEQRIREARQRARRPGEDREATGDAGPDEAGAMQTAGGREDTQEQGDAAAAPEQRREAPQQEMTPEEQAEAIRQRIEQRREQLRQRARRSTDELE